MLREPDAVRASIGLTGQYAAVDENLTGRENLRAWSAACYHLGRAAAPARADELLDALRPRPTPRTGRRAPTPAACAAASTSPPASSAGPPVLFLDEPTTGLDPRSRIGLWEVIAGLVARRHDVLLTTQYLEEADQLADRIVVIDRGRVIAEGTADELKDRLGEDVVDVRVADAGRTGLALELLRPLAATEPRADLASGRISLPVHHGAGTLAEVVRRIDGAGIEVAELSLHRPSLDDVFLTLTGRRAEGAQGDPAADDGDPAGEGGQPTAQRRRFGRPARRNAA